MLSVNADTVIRNERPLLLSFGKIGARSIRSPLFATGNLDWSELPAFEEFSARRAPRWLHRIISLQNALSIGRFLNSARDKLQLGDQNQGEAQNLVIRHERVAETAS